MELKVSFKIIFLLQLLPDLGCPELEQIDHYRAETYKEMYQ